MRPLRLCGKEMFLTTILDPLLTLAYPKACTICGASVEYHRLGECCRECWDSTHIFAEQDHSYARCDDFPFTQARAIGLYTGALRETILHLKREPYLPEIVLSLLPPVVAPLSDNTLIIPVPLHQSRERGRGFNQSLVIAQAVSRVTKLPVVEEVLVRTTQTEKYRAGLDAKGRYDTVSRSFAVVNSRVIRGEYVLLVDDVFTTGATVGVCAEVLLEAGAMGVSVLTIARSRY